MKRSLTFIFVTIILSHLLVTSVSATPKTNYDRAGNPSDNTANTSLPQAETGPRVENFVWAATGGRSGAIAASSAKLAAGKTIQPEAIAKVFLHRQAKRMALSQPAIDNAKLKALHDRGRGAIIASFQQMYKGHEVFSHQINVLMNRNGDSIAASGSFAPQKEVDPPIAGTDQVNDEYQLDGIAAIIAAFADLGGELVPAALVEKGIKGDFNLYSVKPHSGNLRLGGTPRCKMVYYALDNRLIPAWYVELQANSVDWVDNYAYGYVISAEDGEVLFRKNQQSHAYYSYRVFADDTGVNIPFDSPLGNGFSPVPNLDPEYDYPRPPADSTLLTLESGPISSKDPWLPVGATETVGNNVDAYLDIAGADGYLAIDGDIRATTSSVSTFDYLAVADSDPGTVAARNAAVVNLFYVNNFLHDWWYDNGFDEVSGNAQSSNLGRGGVEGDPLLAEGQDFSGRNNANMSTPADGFSPRMQMYLFDGQVEQWMDVPSIATMNILGASFGPENFDLTGTIAAGEPLTACTAITNSALVLGKIALLDRGDCAFADKVANAETAGAIGVIIANNIADVGPMGMSGTLETTLPVVSVSLEDGVLLRNGLAGGDVTATLFRQKDADRDGTMDNGIIAHEWFHYVSNRLVSNASGLANIQGRAMGEGWSDFSTIMMQVRPEDRNVLGNSDLHYPYSTGVYVDSNVYFGIRRAPYSISADIFPFTFKHIEDGVALPDTAPLSSIAGLVPNSEVHNAGEIWANVLWDFYAALLNDGRYTFEQAQERMKDYVIAGLKMTPYAPTFLEARDGIWAAVRASDEQDFQLAAQSFAKYGMGVGAVAPDRWSPSNEGVVESFVAQAAELKVADITIDYDYVNGDAGYCDRDGVLDVGETVLVKVSVENTGTQPFPADLTGQLVVLSGDLEPADGGLINFAVAGDGMSGVANLPITLVDSLTASEIRFALTFPKPAEDVGLILPDASEVTLQVNYDLQAHGVFTDSVTLTASKADWLPQIQAGEGANWQVSDAYDPIFRKSYMWYVPDNASTSDVTLTSPVIPADFGPLSVSFLSYFSFESYAAGISWDGGVIEISVNGGPWQDVVDAGGAFVQGDYNALVLSFDPTGNRSGFGNSNGGLTQYVVDFGNLYLGDNVQFRFRMKSDEAVGEFGWLLDDIRILGASEGAFSSVLDDSGVCVNRPPRAVLPILIEVDERLPGSSEQATVQMTGVADDLDGLAGITYFWQQTLGPAVALLGAESATASFTVPDISEDITLGFSLTVDDGEFTNTATTIVTIHYVNSIPVVWVVSAQIDAAERNEGESVQATIVLSGGGDDPENPQGLSYLWQQTAGPQVTIINAYSAQAEFLAPQINEDTQLSFTLTVSDGELSATTGVVVNLLNVESAPTALPPGDFDVQENHPGVADPVYASLSGAAVDPDGLEGLMYQWQQVDGPSVTLINAAQANAAFLVPSVTQNTPLQFQLTVNDGIYSNDAQVTVTVLNVNRPPVAILPTAQNVPEHNPDGSVKTVIQLIGGAEDPDGWEGLSYSWQQISGQQVLLQSANTAVASFTSPEIERDSQLTFKLTVNDGQYIDEGLTSVTIRNINVAPQVIVPDTFVAPEQNSGSGEQSIITLVGDATDHDTQDTLSYLWEQLTGPAVTIQNRDSAIASFVSPFINRDTDMGFLLTVSDGELSSSGFLKITLSNNNSPPVVSAGGDFNVYESQAMVTLYGNARDAEENALTYEWSQLYGEKVSFQDRNSLIFSFATPGPGVLVFMLTVTDSDGAQAEDVASVVVNEGAPDKITPDSSANVRAANVGMILELLLNSNK
jgi:hypothetical protein